MLVEVLASSLLFSHNAPKRIPKGLAACPILGKPLPMSTLNFGYTRPLRNNIYISTM